MEEELQQETIENKVKEKPSLFGMIMNPREQFEKVRENPRIVVPLIIVTVLTMIGMFLMVMGMDFTNDPEVAGFEEDEMMFYLIFVQATMIIVGLFTPVFSALISTVIYIIIAKITQSTVTFRQLFSMSTYILILTAFATIVNGLVTLFVTGSDPEVLATSLESVIGAGGVLGVLFSSIEVFSIWTLILSAIGLQIVARFSKVLSWSVVIIFFIVSVSFSMMMAAAGSLLGV